MRFYPASAILLAALAFGPAPAHSQVTAHIRIAGLPIGGVIRIGERRPVVVVAPRARGRRVVVVDGRRYREPRVIYVESRRHRRDRHSRHDRYERRVVYYDRYEDRYYDGYRRGLVEVEVYVHDGHYYRR